MNQKMLDVVYRPCTHIILHKRIGLKEAKQLMGLPEDFVFRVSNTQAMKQIGNGVVVPVVKAVAENIARALANIL